MKISKSELEQIIKEEAIRLYQLEKLKKAKSIVDENIRLISEGKKKNASPEEIDELLSGLKNVAASIGKAAGEKLGQVTQAASQKFGQAKQYVADKYAEGEKKAKIDSLNKQKTKIEAELSKYNDMLTKVDSELAALTKKAKAPASKKAAPVKSATTRKR